MLYVNINWIPTLILENFSFADGSSGFLSGWYCYESLRYAFLISFVDAFYETPSMS